MGMQLRKKRLALRLESREHVSGRGLGLLSVEGSAVIAVDVIVVGIVFAIAVVANY